MISIENISKTFGGQVLFSGAGFKVNSRERVGLVGRNGHGKTTLLRMITGEMSVDEGRVVIPRNYRIGYIRQHLGFSCDTVVAEGALGLPEQDRDQLWRVEKILSGLGFSAADMQRSPHEFSGGYQVRLQLAKVLVSEPDLLLLDEPTNYLDISSIRWIEKFLVDWPRELLLVTHDRNFMDRVVTHTVGIHRQKMRKVAGDTGKYYEQIAQDEEIYEKTRVNDDRKRKEMEQFITRFRAKARLANMVQSRVKTLEKMEKREKLAEIRNLEFSFRYKDFAARQMLNVEELNFAYEESAPIIKGFSFGLRAGEKVCVVGRNGKGKSTLLKLLAGELDPVSGQVRFHSGVEGGYFEQTNVSQLVDSRTVEEEIVSAHPDMTPQSARNICGAMMFPGDHALKKVAVLSGGEKSRVMLGRLLARPVNLLLLDEPTNHLDMDSCDSMVAALDSFDGAIVMVTHNEMFLHALAERLIVFDDDNISVFEGSYQDFLDRVGWQDEKADKEKPQDMSGNAASNRKDLRRIRSEIISERSRVLRPLEKKMAGLEEQIILLDGELADLNCAMQGAAEKQDGAMIAQLSKKIHAVQDKMDCCYEDLEEVMGEFEHKQKYFEEKFAAIES